MKKINYLIPKLILMVGFMFTNCGGSDDTDTISDTADTPIATEETPDTTDDSNTDTDLPTENTGNTDPNNPNILLIIADDMGLDATPGYVVGSGTTKPNMPNLENMITNGITYNNAWSNPTCSPTRAGILTGKYGFRTGVTTVGVDLSTSETSLQTYINQQTANTYSQAVVGKWHLSSDPNHPTLLGIDYYAGSLGGGVPSYTNWNFTENGQTTTSTEYVTSKYTDLAIDWIQNQDDKPWFLWLAYNAPHTPFHLPPANLHTQGNLPSDQASIDANPLPYYLAMIEAMDTEIGRLLNSLPSEVRNNTLIVFVGDNGSPGRVVQEYNSRRSKGSVFQGGVNVPLIVSGATVSRRATTDNTLINTLDLFATIADVAGANTTEVNDSRSFKTTFTANSTGKTYAFTEGGNNASSINRAIRNSTHKYVLFGDGSEFLYNLSDNPLENPNLLSDAQAPLSENDSQIRDALVAELNRITAP